MYVSIELDNIDDISHKAYVTKTLRLLNTHSTSCDL